MAFKLRSSAFGPGGEIPLRYTCDGSDVSPPLRWTDPPQSTKGFALIVADSDDVMGVSVHWVLYGVPVPRIRAETVAWVRESNVSHTRIENCADFITQQGLADIAGIVPVQ